ncbi:DUF4227 family protein [Terrilactibacillus sp. S3-3]|nr:DUF4227 family protein [Terrilactibacillus sp. S3-3]
MSAFIKGCLEALKVLAIFLMFTILFYLGLKWLDQNYESYHKYDEPNGRAIKVFQSINMNRNDDGNMQGVRQRLVDFFRNGE